MSLTVFYLARGAGGGLHAATEFLASYGRHPAGTAHDLVILAKGWDGEQGREKLGSIVAAHDARIIDLPDDGFDWGAYFRGCEQIDSEWVCCLNTHSRILSDGWLDKLAAAAAAPGIGAAGATGSHGTMRTVWQFWWPIVRGIAETKGLLKASIAAVAAAILFPIRHLHTARRFPGFPNPHLRSNAFVIRRAHLMEFWRDRHMPRSKTDAHELESGYKGLTRWLASRNLGMVVAGRDGIAYPPDLWRTARTFRTPGQPNLLISDNQTRGYDSLENRFILELSAWGMVEGEAGGDDVRLGHARRSDR